MKKVKIALLMIMALVFVLPACKKGDNDPFLSFRSRKARLVGEWKCTEYAQTTTTVTTSPASTTTVTENFNGTTLTETSTQTGVDPKSGPCLIKYTFENDGIYKYSKSFQYTVTIGGNDIQTADLEITDGTWFFADANKDLDTKDKEAILLYEYGTLSNYMIIDQLKNNTVVFKWEGTTITALSTTTVTGEATYTKE